MGSKIHAWPPPQRFSLSIRLRCGTWAPGDEGANGMKDIKKHLHDFCWIMCQFAGETWNACKCFRNGVKLQMTAETEAWLRLKPWNRCWSSGRDTFCSVCVIEARHLQSFRLQICWWQSFRGAFAALSRREVKQYHGGVQPLWAPKDLEQWTAYRTGMEWAFNLSSYSHDVEERPSSGVCWLSTVWAVENMDNATVVFSFLYLLTQTTVTFLHSWIKEAISPANIKGANWAFRH